TTLALVIYYIWSIKNRWEDDRVVCILFTILLFTRFSFIVAGGSRSHRNQWPELNIPPTSWYYHYSDPVAESESPKGHRHSCCYGHFWLLFLSYFRNLPGNCKRNA